MFLQQINFTHELITIFVLGVMKSLNETYYLTIFFYSSSKNPYTKKPNFSSAIFITYDAFRICVHFYLPGLAIAGIHVLFIHCIQRKKKYLFFLSKKNRFSYYK